MITGVDLAYIDLDRRKPEGFEPGPNDDPADENVAMDVDDNLPYPDPVNVEHWWDTHRNEFSSGTRYLCGKPINEASLNQVLRTGYQRQRAAAALELVLLRPGTPLFEVRARADRQMRLLGL